MNQIDPIMKLNKDLRLASRVLNEQEARFLVDAYYQMQDNRIRSNGQIRAMSGEEPTEVLQWLAEQNSTLEKQIKVSLEIYAENHPVGKWMLSICGIGPVIAAGLLAHIDIHKAPTVGHIWRYAGLDPTMEWNKGSKRPWNADLKRLCFLIGESFIKVQNRESDVYGKIYAERKAIEIANNEAGLYAEQAAQKLAKFKFGADTQARKFYENGKLPPAHIHARARRYAVKLFLSHMHDIWRRAEGLDVPLPYAIGILGHAHMIHPPAIQ